MKIKIVFFAVLYAGFVSCGQNNNNHTHDHSDHDHSAHDHNHESHDGHDHSSNSLSALFSTSSGHSHDNLIELSDEAAKAAGITTGKAETKPFSTVIPAIGEILPMQGDVITVTARNEGFVVFDAKRILSGTPVGQAEKVMVISTQGITQDSYTETVLQAEISYNNNKQAFERNQELYKDQLVTLTELQNSEAALKTAELRYNNLRAGFEKDGLRVSSPTSGYITDVLVNEGDYVSLGQPLFTVSKNRHVILRAEVSPQYMYQLPKVVSANFRTSASGPFYSVSELGGKVTSYGRSIESTSLLVPVYFSLPYSADYPAGSYAEIKLLTHQEHNHIILPATAIVEDFGHFFVYVADEHGYERRDVQIGGNDGIQVAILSGIEEGENVVVTGATRLKLVERLGSLGAEAAHAGHSH